MPRNYELIEKVHRHIVDNPEQHDQALWAVKANSCGTVACAAGHALIFSGLDIMWEVTPAKASSIGEEIRRMRFARMPDGRREAISVAAREVMGLTRAEAEKLFFDTDDDEAVDMLAEILEEKR